jgi:hypothetical protein
MNEKYMLLLKLSLSVDRQEKVGELVPSITFCNTVITSENS